jgi:enoyl-CoA hydratase/carnithine racemase
MGFADDLKKRANEARQKAERIAKDLRKEAETAAESTFRKAEKATEAVGDLLISRERLLTQTEIRLAKKVFAESEADSRFPYIRDNIRAGAN